MYSLPDSCIGVALPLPLVRLLAHTLGSSSAASAAAARTGKDLRGGEKVIVRLFFSKKGSFSLFCLYSRYLLTLVRTSGKDPRGGERKSEVGRGNVRGEIAGRVVDGGGGVGGALLAQKAAAELVVVMHERVVEGGIRYIYIVCVCVCVCV